MEHAVENPIEKSTVLRSQGPGTRVSKRCCSDLDQNVKFGQYCGICFVCTNRHFTYWSARRVELTRRDLQVKPTWRKVKEIENIKQIPCGGTLHSTPKLSRRQKGQEGCPKESKEDRRTKVMPPIAAQLHEDHQKDSWILHPNSKRGELNNNKKWKSIYNTFYLYYLLFWCRAICNKFSRGKLLNEKRSVTWHEEAMSMLHSFIRYIIEGESRGILDQFVGSIEKLHEACW